MTDLLARSAAPLSEEEWRAIDQTVVEVARRQLIARRILHVYGPFGAGIQDLDYNTFRGLDAAAVDIYGTGTTSAVEADWRVRQHIPILYKDFVLYWRDIETSRRLGLPLDTSAAAAAAAFVAYREDDFIFNGLPEQGFPGMLTVEGHNSLAPRDWSEVGAGFEDVVQATRILIDAGFPGPFAIVLNPMRYSQLHRVYANSGVLEIEHIRRLAEAGVYESPVIADYGFVFSTGSQNADIAIGQDLITAYLEATNLNHPFRVLETLVLRVRRPGSICVFEPKT